MTKMKHPLNDVFNMDSEHSEIAESTDLIEAEDTYMEVSESQLATSGGIVDDAEDKEINTKIEEIYSTAMLAYNNQTAYVEILEPRYAARNAEVAANYLNTALNAVSLKAKVKSEKRKISHASNVMKGGGFNNNIIVADRNQILKMIDSGEIIDSEEVK